MNSALGPTLLRMSDAQLPLDFSSSISQRTRAAKLFVSDQPQLFSAVPADIDIHLHSPSLAVADLAGDPDQSRHWLEAVVGPTEQLKSRRVAFSVRLLDRLLFPRPPAKVTLDAAATTVARTLWADAAGCRPLKVERHGRRLVGRSVGWPAGLTVRDAPWTAVSAVAALGLKLDVAPDAHTLLGRRLKDAGAVIASAGLAGSAIIIETNQPEILEGLGLPGLAYAGGRSSGKYRLPLLLGDRILETSMIELGPKLETAIRSATGPVKPLKTSKDFPYTLYSFQASDAGRAMRILDLAGGVLLAGTMGSGKTTVALSLIDQMRSWPLLVVSPLAAFSTWARQLTEMGREFYLASDPPAKAWDRIVARDWDALVISYDRLHAFTELLETIHWEAIVADELQRIASPGSRRSRALRTMASTIPRRIGLSGTPLSNKVSDILPLGAFLSPGEWKPRSTTKDLADLYPNDPIEGVAEHLGTLMVRRRMEDTGVKLPGKTVSRVLVKLTPEQRRALEDLQSEARQEVKDGVVERMHVFAKLQRMRRIVACPAAVGVAGPNPKVTAAIDLAQSFVADGRKTILFAATRAGWKELADGCEAAGLGWVGIWGSSTVDERLQAERDFHAKPIDEVAVFIGTIQSCSESLTLSPTATAFVSVDYVYNPSTLDQAEARCYRLNTVDPVDIVYVHSTLPTGSLDDRMVEILETKRELIAQVVDRTNHVDSTKVHYSLGDLVYLLTGERDERIDTLEADKAAELERAMSKKRHAKASAHRRKYAGDEDVDLVDDGATAALFDDEMFEMSDQELEADEDESFAV